MYTSVLLSLNLTCPNIEADAAQEKKEKTICIIWTEDQRDAAITCF